MLRRLIFKISFFLSTIFQHLILFLSLIVLISAVLPFSNPLSFWSLLSSHNELLWFSIWLTPDNGWDQLTNPIITAKQQMAYSAYKVPGPIGKRNLRWKEKNIQNLVSQTNPIDHTARFINMQVYISKSG